jgi:hypothetical protein
VRERFCYGNGCGIVFIADSDGGYNYQVDYTREKDKFLGLDIL